MKGALTIRQRRALARTAERELEDKIAYRDRLVKARTRVPTRLSAAIAELRTRALAMGRVAK